jgi:hypothetical protein
MINEGIDHLKPYIPFIDQTRRDMVKDLNSLITTILPTDASAHLGAEIAINAAMGIMGSYILAMAHVGNHDFREIVKDCSKGLLEICEHQMKRGGR